MIRATSRIRGPVWPRLEPIGLLAMRPQCEGLNLGLTGPDRANAAEIYQGLIRYLEASISRIKKVLELLHMAKLDFILQLKMQKLIKTQNAMENILNLDLPETVIHILEETRINQKSLITLLKYLTLDQIQEYLLLALDDATSADPEQWDTDILNHNLKYINSL
jgi:hypothetical protein